jgi:Rod binding domain-containing protein
VKPAEKAAEDFEALLLGQMLRAFRKAGSGGWLGSGSSGVQDSTMELAEGQLAQALARSGVLGLSQLFAQSQAQKGAAGTSAETAVRTDSESASGRKDSVGLRRLLQGEL